MLQGPGGAAQGLLVARQAFVSVMMRRRLYEVDYEAFLERHPEERSVFVEAE